MGFLASNDDWGFNTQTFRKPDDMRKYVFPWHKKIVEAAHRNGKPCLLHSCGKFDDVIDDMNLLAYGTPEQVYARSRAMTRAALEHDA